MTLKLDDQYWQSLGFDNLTDETKATIKDEITNKISLEILNNLPPDKLEEYSAIDDENIAREWLKANIPDYEEFISEILEETRQDIKTVLATV